MQRGFALGALVVTLTSAPCGCSGELGPCALNYET